MKNKSIYFVLLLVWMASIAKGQDYIGYHGTHQYQTHVSGQTDYQMGASALSNKFLLSVFREPFLERDFLQDYDDRQSALNRFGYFSASDIRFHYALPNSKITLGLAFEQNLYESIRYTGDAFHLVFFGNKDFKGQNAQLSDIAYSQMEYSTLRLDVNFHSADNKHHFSLLPALHLGTDFSKVSLSDAQLFTAEDASKIQLEGVYLNQKDTGNMGFGGSFGMQYIYHSDPHYFKVSVSDVGRLHWNGVHSQRIDSSFAFQGFEIDNVLHAGEQFSSIELDDTISEVLSSFSDTHNLSVWLPINVQLEYIYSLPGNKWDIGMQFKQRLLTGYKPYVRLDAYYHINEKWHMSGIVAVGGYGGLQVGASAMYQPISKLRIGVETQYLSSLLLFSKSTGLGGFAKITYQL